MARGGLRPGGGRPKGSPNRTNAELRAEAAAAGLTPLEFMLKVLRDTDEKFERRAWAAEKAAPFLHARLATIEHKGDTGGQVQIIIQRFAGIEAEKPQQMLVHDAHKTAQ
jgi:hypothetical protein